jgi:ATP-binding cassette subfamily B protein
LLFRAGLINVGAVVAYFGILLQLLGLPHLHIHLRLFPNFIGLSSARRILELINRETNLDQNASGRTSKPCAANVSFAVSSSSFVPATKEQDAC